MLLFGHLGFGKLVMRPFSRGLPLIALLIGTILPDLIDKPLYYGMCWLYGKHGTDLGIICGTRTFGHTALFLILLILLGIIFRSRIVIALALGVASHLLLDAIPELIHHDFTIGTSNSALLWPFTGWNFPISPYDEIMEHLFNAMIPYLVASEIIGLLLLFI